jgi:Predicted transcriptional regulators
LDTAELLTYFGLTKQEATIYRALLCEGSLTGYETAKLTGISRSNTYTALAGLVDKGAAYLIEGAATRYTPVPTEEFCSNKITELQEYKRLLVESAPTPCKEVDGYITITGEKHIVNRMKNMLTEAVARVYLSVSKEIADLVLPELNDAVARGLKVVVISNAPFDLTGAIVYHAEKTQRQIRLIADSSCVLTGDIDNGQNSTCLYSKKKNLVDLFKESLKNEIQLIELREGK